MKEAIIKIGLLFFLITLLISNVINLHIYFHHEDDCHSSIDFCHSDGDNEDDSSCDLCILAVNLNNLNYKNVSFIFIDDNNILLADYSEKNFSYQELDFNRLFKYRSKNKAPPYHIQYS
mgnify:CR=1 FL=1